MINQTKLGVLKSKLIASGYYLLVKFLHATEIFQKEIVSKDGP